MKEYVLAFIFDKNRYDTERAAVLLLKKRKPEWQAGKYNGIGGKIEKGENSGFAAYREWKEETKTELPQSAFKLFGEMTGPDWRVYLYTGESGELELAVNNDEPVRITPIGYLEKLAKKDKCLHNVPFLVELSWAVLNNRIKDYLIIKYN